MANAGKWLGPHAVTVTKAGTGSGTVTSSSGGIACGATCSADYRLSPQVTLTAAPDAGSSFAGWSGDCSGSSTCVVSASASRHVVATFTKNPPPSGIAKFGFLGHKVSINLRTGK